MRNVRVLKNKGCGVICANLKGLIDIKEHELRVKWVPKPYIDSNEYLDCYV